jgi:hypothetical protein
MQTFDRYNVVFLLVCAVYLYASVFANPETPYLLGGDQVFMWMQAQRMLHGEQLYRDFFERNPPGTYLLYLVVFKLFGPRIWTTNLVVLLLGIALSLLCLRIARSILQRPEAALATALYVVFVFGNTLEGTHHFFSLLAVMGAVAVLMQGKSSMTVAVAGVLLGLATFFTQTRGPVAALGIAAWMMSEKFRLEEQWSKYLRDQGLLFATLVLTWLALSSPYIATVGLRQLWFCQVTYVLEYNELGGRWHAGIGAPEGRPWVALVFVVRWLFGYVLLPTVYAICLWKCWRVQRSAPSDSAARVALLTAVGAALWVEVAQSPDWFRFFCVSAPGVILLIWLLAGAGIVARTLTRVLWIGVTGLAAFQIWYNHRTFTVVQQLPAGRMVTAPLAAEKLGWLAAHTKPGEFVFKAEWPGIYLPLGVRNPVFMWDVARSSEEPPAYVAYCIRQLEEKHVELIVESPADSLPEFRAFLVNRYRLIWRFSDGTEVWQRNSVATASDKQQF